MSAPRYAVETVRGSVGVLSADPQFSSRFSARAEALNLEVICYTPAALSAALTQSPTLPPTESWLIFLTPALGSYFLSEKGRAVWATLTTYPHPHLYLVERSWEQLPLELPPHATRLLLGEYLGLDHAGSPTLAHFSSVLSSGGPLALGEGGLSPFSLMSEDYLLTALVTLLLHNLKTPVLNLANPDSVSLLTLAQHLIPTLSQPLVLHFTDSGLLPAAPASLHHTTHTALASLPAESTLSLAVSALAAPIPAESSVPSPTPEPEDPTPAPEEPSLPTPPAPEAPHPDPTPAAQAIPPTAPVRPTRLPKLEVPPAPPTRSRPRNLSELEFIPRPAPRAPRRLPRLPLLPLLRRKGVKLALRGALFGLIIYLGTLALALGITGVTFRHYASLLDSRAFADLRPNLVAQTAGRYLYANAVAWNLPTAVHLLDLYQQVLVLSQTLASLSARTHSLSAYVLSDATTDLAGDLTASRLEIETLYQQLSLLDGSLHATPPRLPEPLSSQYQALKTQLPYLKKQTLLAKGVASILPDLIALGGRAKYLVLFQNNMELRATGGFIGSYGLLSFENGKLYDFQVYDVYSADGSLKGHVEPPAPIKDVLGEAKWYLRDSNFDPDFPTSARRAEWFLKKSMNQDVAGTIAVNLSTLRSLLQALGPLSLPDYNETITSSNLAERAQYHAEVNFFPGSTAKKEFLSSVSDALFQRLKSADPSTLFALTSALATSLESSDTQFSSLNENTERVLQTLGWNGGIENKPCPTTPCYADYLYQVDSNFGVNKANFYITKDTALGVVVDKDGLPTSTLTTTWKNSATSNAWPAGSYKNYTRTYLPSSATVTSLKIGETTLAPDAYTVSSEHGRLVVAYLVTVPIDNATTTTLTYTLPTPLKPGTLYSLYAQRQPGVRAEDPLRVTLELPLYLKPTKLSPEPAESSAQKLVFSFPTDADHRLSVQF